MNYRIKSRADGVIGEIIRYQVQYFKEGWFFVRWVNFGSPFYRLKDAEKCIELIKNEIKETK